MSSTTNNGKERLPEVKQDIFKVLEDYVSSEDSDFSNDSSDFLTESDAKEEFDSASDEDMDEPSEKVDDKMDTKSDIVADLVQDAVDNNIEFQQTYTRSGKQKKQKKDEASGVKSVGASASKGSSSEIV